jgi:hypothetical protein
MTTMFGRCAARRSAAFQAEPLRVSVLRTAPAIATLREPPVVGRYYMVPTVTFEWRGRTDTWPVLGGLHHDRELIGFDYLHYHFDGRFLTARQLAHLISHSSFHIKRDFALNANVLSESGWRLSGLPRKPTLARRLCKRAIQAWAAAEQAKSWRLADHYGDPAEPIRRPDGRVLCPHRKADLSQFTPDENGIVTCPLHGLRVRCSASVDRSPEGGDPQRLHRNDESAVRDSADAQDQSHEPQ